MQKPSADGVACLFAQEYTATMDGPHNDPRTRNMCLPRARNKFYVASASSTKLQRLPGHSNVMTRLAPRPPRLNINARCSREAQIATPPAAHPIPFVLNQVLVSFYLSIAVVVAIACVLCLWHLVQHSYMSAAAKATRRSVSRRRLIASSRYLLAALAAAVATSTAASYLGAESKETALVLHSSCGRPYLV